MPQIFLSNHKIKEGLAVRDERCSLFTLSSFKFSGVTSNSILGNRYAVVFNVVYTLRCLVRFLEIDMLLFLT